MTEAEATPAPGRSLWADAVRRLRANRPALAALTLLAVIAVTAVLAPLLSPYAYDTVYWDAIGLAPGQAGDHWFGTDQNGRDLFVRTLYGARVSLAIGVITTLVALAIGVVWGATAGYLGGRVDAVMMRIVDVLYSLPLMFLVMILVVVFGRQIILIFIGIGCVEWLTMARIVRGQTLSVKRKEFVEAARAAGVSNAGIVLRHIIPNVTGPVVVFATLLAPQVILVESFLSFLGLGVQEPMTSWGVLIAEGAASMEEAPYLLVIPATFLAVTLLCLNLVGDGLRDALDPRDR